MNSKFISSGVLGVKNQGSQSELQLFCESSNAHYAAIKAPAHSDFSGNITFTMPGELRISKPSTDNRWFWWNVLGGC